MSQTHKHKPHHTSERVWSHCITPDECAARPERQRAHGGIVRIDTCRCGAIRRAEITIARTNYGPWLKRGDLPGRGWADYPARPRGGGR